MKQFFFSIGLAVAGVASHDAAEPRILTVNNAPGTVAMYTSVQEAVNAAAPGDTVLVAGSPHSYGHLDLYKKLNIVGSGYLVEAENNNVPGINKFTTTLSVAFRGNASGTGGGSTLSGIHGGFTSDGFEGVTGEIQIDKCRGGFNFHTPVKLTRCAAANGAGLYAPGSSIRNSIVGLSLELGNAVTAVNCTFVSGNGGITLAPQASISSFIFVVPEAAPFTIRNEGSITHSVVASGPTIVGQRSFLPAGLGNIQNVVAMREILARGETWTDAQLNQFAQLYDNLWSTAPTSVAKGTGLNGVDMGAFGGPTPYVLSGVPSRPRITRFLVPALVSDNSTLKFEVDAQAF